MTWQISCFCQKKTANKKTEDSKTSALKIIVVLPDSSNTLDGKSLPDAPCHDIYGIFVRSFWTAVIGADIPRVGKGSTEQPRTATWLSDVEIHTRLWY